MSYELIGKAAIIFVTFLTVWFGTTYAVAKLTEDKPDGWGHGLAAFVFYGPILGIVAAGVLWWQLP